MLQMEHFLFDVSNCPYTFRCLSPIVDTHTSSTKIALHCCFGRFLKTYFCLKEITYFIVKESGGKYLKENWEKY